MPVDLHLAKSMEDLKEMAIAGMPATNRLSRPVTLYKVVRALYEKASETFDDEERTYVYAYRFLKLLEILYMKDPDKRFLHTQFDNMRKNISNIFSDLQRRLPDRYSAQFHTKKIETVKESKEIPIDNPLTTIFSKGEFMQPKDFYILLQKIVANLLVIDIRLCSEFEDSKLNGNYNLLNIDNQIIERGMSAGKLEEKLTGETKEVFSRRDKFMCIVLMDTDTMKDSFDGTKLKILYDMLTTWDINKTYERPPFVLDGGYIEFVDMYPTLSTNPHVVSTQRYNDLDDLLNLDDITYPAFLERATPSVQRETGEVPRDVEAKFRALAQACQQLLHLEGQLVQKDRELLKVLAAEGKAKPEEASVREREQIQLERAAVETERVAVAEKKNRLRAEFLFYLNAHGLSEADYLHQGELKEAERGIVDMTRKRRKLMEELRQYEVEEEKPETSFPDPEPSGNFAGDNLVPTQARPKPPKINRANKPLKQVSIDTGLNGLVNIKNTCYMNSIIECLRNIPFLRYYFISGEYKTQITVAKPAIILQFGDLVQRLWMGNDNVIRPREFYTKFVVLYREFAKGHHEDANEFFMLLFNLLNEDVLRTVEVSRHWAQQHIAFYRTTQHKTSFFIEQFYCQIRYNCICYSCMKEVQKFDMESIIILPIPEKGPAVLELLLKQFFHGTETSNLYCKECEKVGKVKREISYQPRILCVMLKRYASDADGSCRKIMSRCSFPLDNLLVGCARYKLWAMCLHSGSVNAGHYTAICRNVLDHNWYEYNDESVRLTDLNMPMLEQQIYMLFYQIVDEQKVGFT